MSETLAPADVGPREGVPRGRRQTPLSVAGEVPTRDGEVGPTSTLSFVVPSTSLAKP